MVVQPLPLARAINRHPAGAVGVGCDRTPPPSLCAAGRHSPSVWDQPVGVVPEAIVRVSQECGVAEIVAGKRGHRPWRNCWWGRYLRR
ncbi:hypothetical protein PGN35_020060 [Nodosilinea sp. PGN35]|uniref:hypothetical protein n=1 Tax=Nodosilinea sp. PGN35 TaxID=3020489 RepID=UPI0023B31160|nr:hypothetical protein [Nodosilinea sp. TSF1-S3]MDF0365232.1 hypothetical protein [Nodosilinea sp. TSF1-S3]